jgi:hypothetical protein
VASLLFSPMDRGRRGRPCSWVLLAGAGRSRGGRWWGLLIRRGRIWRPHEGDAHFWWWMEVGPGRRRRRLRSVWWRRGQCGAVFGLRLATCVPAVVARRPASLLPVLGARRPASGALQRRWPTSCVAVSRRGRSAVACGMVSVVAHGGEQQGLVASGAWRQVS